MIVSDAILIIHGTRERCIGFAAHVRARVGEVMALEPAAVFECTSVLKPSDGEAASPEVLAALLIVALAQPEVAAPFAIDALDVGRRLAARLESHKQPEAALEVLELLAEISPEHPGVRRDLTGILRRQGLVQELVERQLARAKSLLRVGRTEDAIAQLREILLLDRNRKDVARMIRDLRFQAVDGARSRRFRVRAAVAALVLSIAGSFVVLHEVQSWRRFSGLHPASADDLAAMRTRLDELEQFMDDTPLWHGSLGALEERGELRVAIGILEERQMLEAERQLGAERQRAEEADLARARGLMHAEAGDFERALSEFQHSLQVSTTEWPHRARVSRDIDAIAELLEERR